MRRQLRVKTILITLSALCLFACSPLKTPSIKEYKLNSPSTLKIARHRSRKILLVARPVAASGFTDSDMKYTEKPYGLESFAVNSWVASPSKMLQSVLIESMQNSGYFRAVVPAPFTGLTNLRLDTQLLSLKQDFVTRPSHIDVLLSADLVNVKSNLVIASRRFHLRMKAPEDTPYGGVLAANKAIKNIMTQLVRFVVRAAG